MLHRSLDKSQAFSFFIQIVKRIRPDIAESPGIQCVKIAGIYTAVRFKYILYTTDPAHVAALRSLSAKHPDHVFKASDIDKTSCRNILIPLIKECLEKLAIPLRR